LPTTPSLHDALPISRSKKLRFFSPRPLRGGLLLLLRTSAAKAGKIGLLVVSAPCFAPHSSRSAPFRSSSSRGFHSSSSRSRPSPDRTSTRPESSHVQ